MHEWRPAVAGAQQGSLAAFDQLVRRFQHMAVGYAYSILGDFHLAEDAAQEAFVQAYQDLRMLRVPEAFPAWLRRIVAKQCDRAVRRRRLVTVPLEASAGLPDPSQGPLESVQQQETRQEVLAAIGALPEHERVTTTLFYIDGYSLAEVGEFLEVPVGTVKRRLHSARNRLRERILAMAADTIRQHAPGEQFGDRVGKVLEGIERIHWQTTSCLCFVGSAAVTLRYLGEQASADYVMGISGGAFSSLWGMPWFDANSDLLFIGEEPIPRTFWAFGYGYSLVFLIPARRSPAGPSLASSRPSWPASMRADPSSPSGASPGHRRPPSSLATTRAGMCSMVGATSSRTLRATSAARPGRTRSASD
jgi:RNA polymerase sigma factor (sigma-70 family)